MQVAEKNARAKFFKALFSQFLCVHTASIFLSAIVNGPSARKFKNTFSLSNNGILKETTVVVYDQIIHSSTVHFVKVEVK